MGKTTAPGWLYEWTLRRWRRRLLRAYGGIQSCPWCLRIMQESDETRVRPWQPDRFADEFTCGICKGTSVWKWEIGFVYVCEGQPPPPKFKRWFDHPAAP